MKKKKNRTRKKKKKATNEENRKGTNRRLSTMATGQKGRGGKQFLKFVAGHKVRVIK